MSLILRKDPNGRPVRTVEPKGLTDIYGLSSTWTVDYLGLGPGGTESSMTLDLTLIRLDGLEESIPASTRNEECLIRFEAPKGTIAGFSTLIGNRIGIDFPVPVLKDLLSELEVLRYQNSLLERQLAESQYKLQSIIQMGSG